MITLCMDTSHVWLALGLIKDDQVIAKYQEKCWKQQSEEIFPCLIKMFESVSLSANDVDQVVITEGPGSYTGVRIAMTIAKVFCAMKDLPIYTVNSLQLYAGNQSGRVLMDARGKRAYTALYEDGKEIEAPSVQELDKIQEMISSDTNILGDGHLLDRDDVYTDIIDNFLVLRNQWKKWDNVHLVVPEYLKTSASYLAK